MGILLFKPGVRLNPAPNIAGARLLGTIERVSRGLSSPKWPAERLIITCGSEGHPPTDPHTLGQAFDVRTHEMSDEQKKYVVRECLLDLQEDPTDAPTELIIPEMWFALATKRWFGQVEYYQQVTEHIHLQLRKGAVFP